VYLGLVFRLYAGPFVCISAVFSAVDASCISFVENNISHFKKKRNLYVEFWGLIYH